MIAIFVIFLREGIEALMIVAILMAYLKKIDQRRYFKDVIAGVVSALVLALVGGIVVYATMGTWSGRPQAIFETVTYLLAAVVLTYMTLWMNKHARTISNELRERTDVALTSGERRGFFLLAFQAVGREGLETVVFTLAIIETRTARGMIWGALAGLALALAISSAIYQYGVRIKMGRFFKILGVLLLFFAVGLFVDAIGNLQRLGWLPILNHQLWNTSRILSDGSALGDVLHSFFGYSSQPTVLQLIGGSVFLVTVLWRMLAHQRGAGEVQESPSPQSSS